jgi:hypothetical protein
VERRAIGLLALCLCASAARVEAQPRSSHILVREGRAMARFGGSENGATAFAEIVNAIHAQVRDRATVYAILVPSAHEFYAADSAGRQRANIELSYTQLDPAIRTVDVHAELASHMDEDLYFRTDHHWTGLGGYYGYRAFCAAAGLEAVPLDRLERRVIRRQWLGSLYQETRDPSLRPDVVEIFVPPTQAEVRAQRRADQPERAASLFQQGAGGYVVFLGGDHAIMRVRTSVRNGRRAILIKNSHGNPFAVQLVSHYEELVFVDYRTFRGGLSHLLAESAMPTDLLVMMGTVTANSEIHRRRLLSVLRER